MNDFNNQTISGRLTKDAEVKSTPTGKKLTIFSVAVNRWWKPKDKSEWENDVTFFDCVWWGNQADAYIEKMVKGARVFVSGETRDRSYEAQDGSKRRVKEIYVDKFFLLVSEAKDSSKQSGEGSVPAQGGNSVPDFNDLVPDVPPYGETYYGGEFS